MSVFSIHSTQGPRIQMQSLPASLDSCQTSLTEVDYYVLRVRMVFVFLEYGASTPISTAVVNA